MGKAICLLLFIVQKSHPFRWLFKYAQYRIWPQVASLTLGARGPASPCSPFGLWPQTRIRLWLSNPNAGKAVCPLTGYKKATLSGGFSNMPSIGFEPMTFPMSRERATPAPTGLKSGKEAGCLTELPSYYSKSSF